MKTIIKELALVLTLIWLWLVLSACSQASKAAPLLTQTALPPTVIDQPAKINQPVASDQPTEESWKTFTNPLFKVAFRYPADWKYVEGDQASEKYAGEEGFFRTGGMSGGGMSLNEVAQSEAFHVLRPFGTQPTIESLIIQGQQAQLIIPSEDQSETSPDMVGMAELILQYPKPLTINGSSVEFFVLFADTEHIRLIAESLSFLQDEQNPTPTASSSKHTLAGLVYKQMDTAETRQIGNDGQHHLLINSPFAATSWDGHSAIYEEDDDLWLSDLQTGALRQLTDTPDRVEWYAQWWPGNQAIIIFQSQARSSWTPSEAGQLSIINFDGSNYSVLSDISSIGLPSPSPDGKTIAFDQNGTPWIYDLDTGMRPFDPSEFGYHAVENNFYFSPSWSSDGWQLSWWIETDQSDARYQLVVFDLKNQRYFQTDTYDPPDSVTWRPQAPVWSYDGIWLAYITREEVSLVDLYIIHPDGSDQHRLGLATDPVWSPDENRLVFTQWPPRSDSSRAAEPFLVSAQSWESVKIDLPEGSIPSAWLAEAVIPGSSSLILPMFSPPEWWKIYSNPELGFEFYYPPEAVLEAENGALNINFPFNPGTTLEVKSITVEVRPVVEETCYGGLNWQGVIPINGVDFNYFQGKMWEQAMGGLSFYRSDLAAFSNEFCYRIALRMAMRDDSIVSGNPPKPTPDRDDLDIEILLNVLSTLNITR